MTSTKILDQRSKGQIGEAPTHPFDKRWFVHLNARIQGPFTGHEIALMTERHEVSTADLVYSEGGVDWVQLGQDPILGTLFANSSRPPSSSFDGAGDSQRTRRRAIAFTSAFLFFVLCGWIVWPYYSAYSLAAAVRDGDALALERGVAWDSLRQGLRDDLNAALLQTIGANAKDKSSEPGAALGSGFAAMIGPAIIDRMVNSYVTPQTIANISRPNKVEAIPIGPAVAPAATNLSEAIQSARKIRWEQIRYAFFFGSPFLFKVDFIPEQDPLIRSPISLLFAWEGSWKLTRIILPADAMGGPSTAAKSRNDQRSLVVNIPPPIASSTPAAPIRKELVPLDVRLTAKGFKDKNIRANDFEDEITIGLTIQNTMDKDIRAFDGTLRFTDLLDNEIFATKLAINDSVQSGATLNWKGSLKYNQFISSHQRLRNAQKENLKIQFISRKVLFVDGSVKEYSSQ